MRYWVLAVLLIGCAKARHEVMPCDQDLGYASRKMHLANVQYLDENRGIDWFELYENLVNRRNNTAPQNCIPLQNQPTIEQMIERSEHDVKELR